MLKERWESGVKPEAKQSLSPLIVHLPIYFQNDEL
jgi:hypothetical protein